MKKTNQLKLFIVGLVLLGSGLACSLPDLGGARFVNPSVTVNTYMDTFDAKCTEDDCSLRDAVFKGNNSSRTLEIILPGGLYNLNQNQEGFYKNDDGGLYGDLDISGRMIIIGDGIDVTNINGRGADRIFHVLPGGSLELQSMTIFNGNGDDWELVEDDSLSDIPGDIGKCITSIFQDCGTTLGPGLDFDHRVDEIGGGIIANRGYLKLDKVLVTQGIAEKGGGLLNLGEAEIIDSNIFENESEAGGGIYNDGTLTSSSILIANNFGETGGGIYNSPNGVINSQLNFFYQNQSSNSGGGIYNNGGVIEFSEWTASFDNSADAAGGFVYNSGQFTLHSGRMSSDSFFDDNLASMGGFIFNAGSGNILITGFAFQFGNADQGSAIFNQGSMEIRESFFNNNQANEYGSSVFQSGESAALSLRNVTISREKGSGSAIHADSGSVTLLNVTIAQNETGGLSSNGASIEIRNTILSDNDGPNCIGSITSLGHNIESGNSCGLNTLGDMPNTSPQIGSSFIVYIPLTNDSPAIDNGDNDNCPATDVRIKHRPSGLGCDIGSFELQELVFVPLEVTPIPLQPEAVDPAAELPAPEPLVEYWADPEDISAGGCTIFYWHVENVKSIIFGGSEREFDGSDKDCMCKTQTYPLTVNYLDNTQDKKYMTINVTGTCAPEAPEAEQPASISGIVWNDANANGSQQGGENGLSGVTVFLGKGSCGSTGFKTANTNASGGYNFTGLAAGTYCVSVQITPSCGAVSSATTNQSFTVTLNPGGSASRSFGFQKFIC